MRRHIKPSDLPAPPSGEGPETSRGSAAKVVARPQGALPKVPDGFSVQVFASGFKQPRTLRVAPNGDVFLSESGTGRVLVFRASARELPAKPEVFAENLEKPYGIVFYPAADPRHVYVAAANQVVRYPYRDGAVKAAGPAEVIVADIPTKRHWTRDLAVSRDGKQLFRLRRLGIQPRRGRHAGHDAARKSASSRRPTAAAPPGAKKRIARWCACSTRKGRRCAITPPACAIALASRLQPGTDDIWCVVNERDHLGPHLVPDFMARLQDGAFYGWPWYYIGDHEDPALKGKRPDLKGQVRTPDVLFQAHSSALAVAFYDRDAFPAEYRGDAFVTLHGSHTRPERTGYKVIRVRMKDGKPTGEYEDFMTGFLVDNDTAWGRPAGVAVTRDGALLVSDDANGTIFRVTHK